MWVEYGPHISIDKADPQCRDVADRHPKERDQWDRHDDENHPLCLSE